MDAAHSHDDAHQRELSYRAGKAWLDAFGWYVDGGAPAVKKAVVVAAPHTSNWDLPFTLAVAAVLGVRISWIGKKSLFRPPFGTLMKQLGGVPVERNAHKNQVEVAADLLRKSDELFLIIAPEGTRGQADRWKTGFYRIALSADVPIVLGYLDYRRRCGGLGTLFYPTGDLEKDMIQIEAFYKGIQGKFPDKQSTIRLLERSAIGLQLSVFSCQPAATSHQPIGGPGPATGRR